ncbi:uncharacterized protein LOC110897862 isoform X1 [Helianthus annuus]|uniref:uncharacterized protein LOC110897862 isoform X1 n=1 Tax=Helianthus annuus TaxID=4232 RepID=UPI000B8F4B94|nr:uncharacterized protein LOC110897862 isoform X1 [Helianthus annuus]
MPKDPSTKGHHGIGFITFSNADSVDDLMSKTHELGGSDVVVDRATLRKTISDQLAACRLRVTDMVPIMLMLQLDMLHWELLQHMIIQALSMEEENPLGALRLAPFKTKQHATFAYAALCLPCLRLMRRRENASRRVSVLLNLDHEILFVDTLS